MASWIDGYIRDEEGAVVIEYVLIAAMTAILAIAALTYFGNNVSDKYSYIGSSVADAG